MAKFRPSTGDRSLLDGYVDDARNASENSLCPPTQNVFITKTGEAYNRPGKIDSGWDLGENGKGAVPFPMPNFGITFFALGTKVKYIDHNNNHAVVDTGITLTDGTVSSFEEYNGVVYVTNATDGCYGFLVTKLNGAVSGGAGTIVTDVEGAGVASAFDTQLSPGTKNLRIDGTNEQYASITVNTGTFTLSGTASQAYSDNAIALVVYDLTSTVPKCDKIVAWKESLNCIGLSVDDTTASSDRNQTTIAFSQFATAATAEASVTFSGGTAGTELVGKSGKLVDAIATRDYLYLFKETATYFIAVEDVNIATGSRIPQPISQQYGCVGKNCVADLGDGVVAFLSNKRIIAIRISTDSGAAVVFPDESFDTPVRNLLSKMDADQTNALMYYSASEKRLYVELDIDGVKTMLTYNNEIKQWEGPHTGVSSRGYFERKGVLYSTVLNEDTVLENGVGYQENGQDIESVMASPLIEFEDGRQTMEFYDIELSGSIINGGEITVQNVVNEGTPQLKTIDSSNISFELGKSLGAVVLGTETLGADDGDIILGDWDKKLAIYPRIGNSYQCIMSSTKPFTFKSWRLNSEANSKTLLTLS